MLEPRPLPPNGLGALPILVAQPAYRRNVEDYLRYARRIPHITGTWEADVTHAIEQIRTLQRRACVGISLNAYLIYLLARAAARHPEVQTVRVPFRRRVARYDGVDVSTAVEQRRPGEAPLVVPSTVRDAHRKSLAEICIEMRTASKSNLFDGPDVRWRARLAHFPRPVRRWIWRWVDLDPARRRRVRGTIALTNLNFVTIRDSPVFGYPLSLLTTALCVGSLYDRLVPCDDAPRGFRVSKRLCLTAQCDHRYVDGAPMTRFARAFHESLERGDGLGDEVADELVDQLRAFAARPAPAETP